MVILPKQGPMNGKITRGAILNYQLLDNSEISRVNQDGRSGRIKKWDEASFFRTQVSIDSASLHKLRSSIEQECQQTFSNYYFGWKIFDCDQCQILEEE